jgi:hypothetical protein
MRRLICIRSGACRAPQAVSDPAKTAGLYWLRP